MRRVGLLGLIAGVLTTAARAEDNTLVTFDGVTTNLSVPIVIGATGTNNGLIITNTAVVSSLSSVIGDAAGADHNYARVSGPGSRWLAGKLTVGKRGTDNSLVIADGAQVVSGQSSIGGIVAAASNCVVVTDAGSSWAWDRLTVGSNGSQAQLVVTNGARLEGGECVIGSMALVAGAGAALDAWRVAFLGTSDDTFIVTGGGQVNCEYGRLEGQRAIWPYGRRHLFLRVSGSGSRWLISREMGVYLSGGGLSIIEGGQVECPAGSIAGQAFDLRIEGPGSLLLARTNLCLDGLRSGWDLRNTNVLNWLTVARGGALVVTNAAGNASLTLSGIVVDLEAGSLIVDRLWMTNQPQMGGAAGLLQLKRGLVSFGQATLCSPTHPQRIWVLGEETGLGPLEVRGSNLVCLTDLTLLSNVVMAASGTISNLMNRGEVRVGKPLGTLQVGRVRADLPYQGLVNEGTISLDIGGPEEGRQHDVLIVRGGLARLGGRLQVELLGDYRPAWSNSFRVVRWGSYEGAFTNAPPGARLAAGPGSFRVVYTPQELLLTDYVADADGDGVDDLWAASYFGHSPLDASERAADSDGDGASNQAEFVAGTDPQDARSVFKVISLTAERTQARLRFVHMFGKRHRIWYSPWLGDWKEVPAAALVYPQAGLAEWVDDGKATGGLPLRAGARFYRVSVE